jgi:hypothetical protein
MESAPGGGADAEAEGMATDGIVSKGILPAGGTFPAGAGTEAPGRDSGAIGGPPGTVGGATAGASRGGGAINGGAGSSGEVRAGPNVGEVGGVIIAGF